MGKARAALIFLILAAPISVRAATPAPAVSRDETYKELKVLVDMLGYIQSQYVSPQDARNLVYGAAEGMVDTLDPFSEFLDPEASDDMKSETEGRYGGVGIKIYIKDDWLTVMTPMPGTPAYRAGILPEDRITAIDGQSAKGITYEEAFKELRGNAGSKITLTIARSEDDNGKGPWTTKDYLLKREIIKIDSVEPRMIGKDVGYARIVEFSASTPADLLAALDGLKKQGMQKLILDLRNNPGGLLDSGVAVASDFIGDNKLIVYTQGRDPASREDFRGQAQAPFADVPLIVLVNGGTASAAEIVSGALQDYRRAVIVGERTYGKFSVQSIIPLDDGSALRLTVAHYYTPLGRCLARDDDKGIRGGLMPDVVVPVSKAVESKLYAQWDMVYVKNKKAELNVGGKGLVTDETLNRALEIFKADGILSAAGGN